jgi:hypothetical protein
VIAMISCAVHPASASVFAAVFRRPWKTFLMPTRRHSLLNEVWKLALVQGRP